MQDTDHKILVWLPSPMGDAVLCIPALRAIRKYFSSSKITFLARPAIRELLSSSPFNDDWLVQSDSNPIAIVREIRKHKFAIAILFKNSIGSTLTVFLAGIPSRIGYAREGRGFLLTEKLYPQKLSDGRFKPVSMIDYYLAIASCFGADTSDRTIELPVDSQSADKLKSRFPEIADCRGPLVILVPGGAFGPSKCWPVERFAQTADWLISTCNARVFISVGSDPFEKQIAKEICALSKHKLVSLAQRPVSLSELKAIFTKADLIVTNDTGPRHIGIALRRKVITLFGPNDPVWTDTGYENEIQIVGNVPCAPCTKAVCKKSKHLCMEAITVEMVCNAAEKGLKNCKGGVIKTCREFIETSESFFVDPNYKAALDKLGLTTVDNVFSFNAGKSLSKDNLARFRSRLQFETGSPAATLFLKRYDRPPIMLQLRNRLSYRSRRSCSFYELESAGELAAAGINTPKVVCYGEQRGRFFEKRSFIITEKLADAESLERKLPACFIGPVTLKNFKLRRKFIAQLASFIKKFHDTNYRHRDLYFSHIYYSGNGAFYLIDLARAFKPVLLRRRFQIKDIAQLYYSAPARYFLKTDRMRFYLAYVGRNKLTKDDKVFIRKVINKAESMARHDIKYGRIAPFAK
jgi:heptosyltransferase-2